MNARQLNALLADVDNRARELGLERLRAEVEFPNYITDFARIPNRDEIGEIPAIACADYITVPVTLWGDYVGSDLGRSNFRSLQRDYPELFTVVSEGYGAKWLVVGVTDLVEREDWEELLLLFSGLEEQYPLYDEEDHSALEMELADEAWDAWVRYDLIRALDEAGVDTDELDDDDLREQFYTAVSNTPQPYYCESATSLVFPYWDDVVAALVEHYGATVDAV